MMKVKALVLVVLAFALVLNSLTCQEVDGQCWPRTDDSTAVGVGAGGGPILPPLVGGGDYPASPDPVPQDIGPERDPITNCLIKAEETEEESPPDNDGATGNSCASDTIVANSATYVHCDGTCKSKCPTGVSGFSPSVFKFSTLIPDDGKDGGGGYQVASATLSFFRWTALAPESWTCPVTVGMPIRTVLLGTISPTTAATMTSGVASEASFTVMHTKPELPPGIFCSKLVYTMRSLFNAKYPGLGASVTL